MTYQQLLEQEVKYRFQQRQAYQKAILYLNEDLGLIKEYIELELEEYWLFLRQGDLSIVQRILTQLQLYIELLPDVDRQHIEKKRIELYQDCPLYAEQSVSFHA